MAGLTLLTLAAAVVTVLAAGDVTAFIRGDWPTSFFPTYADLGERLRAFDIPGWNPHQFSGAPFAGDPSSGWGYVLAMLFYTILPPEPATIVFIGSHIVLSAIAAYTLGRLSGLGPGGAFVAGVAYGFPWLLPAAAGMILFFQVTTWLPIALIGIELARLPGSPARRFGGLVLSGLAIGQILASWLGQGGYYAMLVIGGWVAWRTVVTPPVNWPIRARLVNLFGIGGGILLLGLALNAAALLVRLDANRRTNLAGGVYTGISGWADANSGYLPQEIGRALAGGFSEASWQYAGAAVIAAALLAPFVASRWPPLVFWLIVASVAIVLALRDRTPIQAVMYGVLPRFESLHGHLPGRALLMAPLASAMLAGATADAVSRGMSGERWRRALALLAAAAIAGGAILLERQEILSQGALLAAAAALAIVAMAIDFPIAARQVLAPLALAAVILWDPTGRVLSAGWGPGLGPERSLRAALATESEGFLYQNGAAAFLTDATRNDPGRYAGFDPALLPDIAASGDLPPQAYRNHWLGPAHWLLVFSWATWFGLEDTQGYNPVQIQRYVEYIDALNGHRQEYHETDVFPAGLPSPLLDLLNLRFLIVPADAPERAGLEAVVADLPTVYTDTYVRILENPEAFPRAWLVHEARQVAPGEALTLLADGAVDARRTALLETEPPPLQPAPGPSSEEATYLRHEPDRIEIEVDAQTPALLVLSEVWDPGWSATVDGAPAPLYLADHVFRAVPVPAGQHTVELRYDPLSLRLGIAITLATLVAIVAVWGGLSLRKRRRQPKSWETSP